MLIPHVFLMKILPVLKPVILWLMCQRLINLAISFVKQKFHLSSVIVYIKKKNQFFKKSKSGYHTVFFHFIVNWLKLLLRQIGWLWLI